MSVRAISAAFDSDYGSQTAARRLVLIALADSAGDDGITWVSQSALAEKACVSEPTVRAALRDLEDRGMLQVVKVAKGRTRRNVYRFVFAGMKEPDYDRMPFALDEPFPTTVRELRSSDPDDRNSVAATTVTELRSRARGSSLDLEPSVEPLGPLERRQPERPKTVDGRPVSGAEYELAVAVLAEFNEVAGSVYRAKDWLIKIIMRIREFPDLVLEAHAVVIRRSFASPWWTGTASPSVVYGNRGVFERAVHAVREEPPERGMTAEEMEAFAEPPHLKRERLLHEALDAE